MYGKILIQCDLIVRTGMHIGASGAFSAIGAVDSPVVRDTLTGNPIVPGSSLKGKLRTLLARSFSGDIEHMPDFKNDEAPILRLFGSADPVRAARLQFADCFVNNKEQMKAVGLTDEKLENAINLINTVALLAKGMKLLQLDYLGGHGSRGSGRVSFTNFHLTGVACDADTASLTGLFEEVANYELFSV